jgi:hypothetical protein
MHSSRKRALPSDAEQPAEKKRRTEVVFRFVCWCFPLNSPCLRSFLSVLNQKTTTATVKTEIPETSTESEETKEKESVEKKMIRKAWSQNIRVVDSQATKSLDSLSFHPEIIKCLQKVFA